MGKTEPSVSPCGSNMTRSELYELVWREPMKHVAKRFGLNPLELKTVCRAHDVPVPRSGHWANLSGKNPKKFEQKPLPPSDSDPEVDFNRGRNVLPPEIQAVKDATQARERATPIVVPKERPERLHPIAKEAEDGVVTYWHPDSRRLPGPGLGWIEKPELVDRAILLLDTLLKALAERGYPITRNDNDVSIEVRTEVFRLCVYETRESYVAEARDERCHKEWKRLGVQDRHPEHPCRAGGKLPWNSWASRATGRLAFTLYSPDRGFRELAGVWHDRTFKRAEDYLNDAIVALEVAAATVERKRAAIAERRRQWEEAEEKARRARQKAIREQNSLKFLTDLALRHVGRMQAAMLVEHFEQVHATTGDLEAHSVACKLRTIIEQAERCQTRERLAAEIRRLDLLPEDF